MDPVTDGDDDLDARASQSWWQLCHRVSGSRHWRLRPTHSYATDNTAAWKEWTITDDVTDDLDASLVGAGDNLNFTV